MKKLFLICSLFLLSFSVKAQYPVPIISNNALCDLTCEIFYYDLTTCAVLSSGPVFYLGSQTATILSGSYYPTPGSCTNCGLALTVNVGNCVPGATIKIDPHTSSCFPTSASLGCSDCFPPNAPTLDLRYDDAIDADGSPDDGGVVFFVNIP